MEKRDRVFILLQLPMAEAQNPDNAVTQHVNSPQVKSILGIQFFQGIPQTGQHLNLFVGLLYERALPEEQQPRPQKKEARERQAFEKRPKPQPLR